MRRLATALASALLLVVPATASAGCTDAELIPSPTNLDRIAAATFCLHNEERATEGLPALKWSSQLAGAANAHSLDMVTRLFFDHDNPDGLDPRDRIEATGYGPDYSGENIAWGIGGDTATPAHIMENWMESRGHRANILRPQFEHVGLGVAYGPPRVLSFTAPGATYTANFGSRTAPDPDPPVGTDPDPGAGEQPPDDVDDEAAPEAERKLKEAKRPKALKHCLKKPGKSRKKRKPCKRRSR